MKKKGPKVQSLPMLSEDSEEKKTFDFQGKNLFLTWSDMAEKNLGPKLIGHINQRQKLLKWIWGEELHADGGIHYHILMKFQEKLKTKNCAYFDYEGKHCNWVGAGKKVSAWWQEKLDYCIKDGKFEMSYEDRIIGRTGYIRKKADLEAWKADIKFRGKSSPWPFEVFGITIDEPDPFDKKSNYLFIGPPDIEKSKSFSIALKGKRVYCPSKNHPWDNYQGERLLLLDDMIIGRDELFTFVDYTNLDRSLSARYFNKPLKSEEKRQAIILCNPGHEPNYITDMAFRARFNIVKMELCTENPGMLNVDHIW